MEISEAQENNRVKEKKSCVQEGFLPVPISSVPPESLAGLEIFIHTPPTYNLYKSTGLDFGVKDYHRLIEAGTKYVYIETKNHQRYYDAIENTLSEIVNDKYIATERKCEILYATTLALTQELTSSPPDSKTINKAERLTKNTVDLVLKNQKAFGHLFNMSNHDFYTATHTSNVSVMLVAFASKIGIKDSALLNELGTGSLLHDVGKIFVPQELLNKSEKLTDREFDIIKSHVAKGVEHLTKQGTLSNTAIKLIAEHHEKLDGKGYPNALAGEDISIYGRMITIVDMFEAMTSVRPYRSTAMSSEKAMSIISEMAPAQLDQRIVNSFDSFIELSTTGNTTQQCTDDDMILEALGIKKFNDTNPSGRRHKRFYFRTRCTMQIISKLNGKIIYGPEIHAIAHNISQSGIGILSSQKYKENMFVCVKINVPRQKTEIKFFAEIRRVDDHSDGWFTIGAEFLRSAPLTILQKFITRSNNTAI